MIIIYYKTNVKVIFMKLKKKIKLNFYKPKRVLRALKLAITSAVVSARL